MASSNDIVEYWQEQYIPKYMGDCYGDIYLSQVDSTFLYEGLDSLSIKVTGETTGVDGVEWFKDLPAPDIRTPFNVMVSRQDYKRKRGSISLYISMIQVSTFVDAVNERAVQLRDDNLSWKPKSVLGIGPSNNFYFLSNEVVRGSTKDGFHRNERGMLGKAYETDGNKYLEYNGFVCANRKFRVYTHTHTHTHTHISSYIYLYIYIY